MRKALLEAVAKMSHEELVGLWTVCSRSAENQREHLAAAEEEGEALEKLEKLRAELRAAEAIEQAGDAFMRSLAV